MPGYKEIFEYDYEGKTVLIKYWAKDFIIEYIHPNWGYIYRGLHIPYMCGSTFTRELVIKHELPKVMDTIDGAAEWLNNNPGLLVEIQEKYRDNKFLSEFYNYEDRFFDDLIKHHGLNKNAGHALAIFLRYLIQWGKVENYEKKYLINWREIFEYKYDGKSVFVRYSDKDFKIEYIHPKLCSTFREEHIESDNTFTYNKEFVIDMIPETLKYIDLAANWLNAHKDWLKAMQRKHREYRYKKDDFGDFRQDSYNDLINNYKLEVNVANAVNDFLRELIWWCSCE